MGKEWNNSILCCADDTNIFVSANDLDELKNKLEEDAKAVLNYMASNGLVANEAKTALLIFRKNKRCPEEVSVKVGKATVPESACENFLGIKMSRDLSWKPHIQQLCQSLRHKNFMLRRLSKALPSETLLKVLDGLVFSTVRYCLPVFAQARIRPSDPSSEDLNTVQVQLNHAMRVACQKSLEDRVTIGNLLKNANHYP